MFITYFSQELHIRLRHFGSLVEQLHCAGCDHDQQGSFCQLEHCDQPEQSVRG